MSWQLSAGGEWIFSTGRVRYHKLARPSRHCCLTNRYFARNSMLIYGFRRWSSVFGSTHILDGSLGKLAGERQLFHRRASAISCCWRDRSRRAAYPSRPFLDRPSLARFRLRRRSPMGHSVDRRGQLPTDVEPVFAKCIESLRRGLAGQASELFQLCLFHAPSHTRKLDRGLCPIQSVPVRQLSDR